MAKSRNLLLALVTAAALLGGCVYRPDIQQGNLLTMEDIRKVEVGMSRSQVRFLLGTPMVSDPFAPHRWDYVYRMQYGRDRAVITAHFVVWFEGDKVAKVETLDNPEPSRKAREAKQKKQKEAAPPAAPASPPPG
jgi:outer membrane protein assembly factor BamE